MGNVVRTRSQHSGFQRKISLSNLGKIFEIACPTCPAIVPPCPWLLKAVGEMVLVSQTQICTEAEEKQSQIQPTPLILSLRRLLTP